MRRLIFPLLALLAIGVAFFAFYRSLDRQEYSQLEGLRAIPSDAALLLETAEIGEIWRDLADKSLIWKTLQATDLYFRLNANAQALDSLIRKDERVRSLISSLPITMSAHITGNQTYDFLYVIALGEDAEVIDVKEALAGLLRTEKSGEVRSVDGIEISVLNTPFSDRPIQFYVGKNLLALSLSATLIEQSARALLSEQSVWNDSLFQELRATRGLESRGQVYVQYAAFRALLGQFIAEDQLARTVFQNDYADWSTFDIRIGINSLILNGFVAASDSGGAWLNTLRGSKSVKPILIDYMPESTAYFSFMGFDSIAHFLAKKDARNTAAMVSDRNAPYREKCNCDIDQLATGWIGNQMAFGVLEPDDTTAETRSFGLFRSSDQAMAFENLQFLATAFTIEAPSQKSEIYLDRELFALPIGPYYGDVLSEIFAGMTDPHYVLIDDVVVMSASREVLREIIRAHDRGEILSANKNFQAAANQLSETSNFMVYSSLSKSTEIYPGLLKAAFAEDLKERSAVLKQFPVLLYQAAYHKDNRFYNTLYLHHSEYEEKENSNLWASELNAPMVGTWHAFSNHTTGAAELLVQDSLHRLYLFSPQGKSYWEKALDGPIIGGIRVIHGFKNKKFQMVFATENTLYILDRNGQNIDNFPVSLKGKTSSGVAVMDYDGDRDYRFLIGGEGGEIWAYDMSGKSVKGWDFAGDKSAIRFAPDHIRIRNKDYIFALTAKDAVYLLNRKGEIRQPIKELAPRGIVFKPFVYTNDDILKSGFYALDSIGNFVDFPFGKSEIAYSRLSETELINNVVALVMDKDQPLVAVAESASVRILGGSELKQLAKVDVYNPLKLEWHRVEKTFYLSILGAEGLLIFDQKGERIMEVEDAISSPIIGDFDKDGKLELIYSRRAVGAEKKGEIIALPFIPLSI